ncbi:BglG family transcription antiterminator [Neobacillus pocheonensis]|uniref:BglG family transcription antiterminator n=1 Tax=Neobacillus pocheonensis TaxID=363869 RepID=UPI003D2880AC
MNDRQKAMLKILLDAGNNYLSSHQIADELDCSEKTVRNDSKILDQWLSNHSTAALSRKPNIGFRLEISEAERSSLLNKLYNVYAVNDEMEEKERLYSILELLLIKKKTVTIQKVAELFFVNKAIVKKDFEKIEAFLKKSQLSLTTKRKLGLEVEGSEHDWRLAISKIPSFIETDETNSMVFWEQLFEMQEIAAVGLALEEVNHSLSNPYTDETIHSLQKHILIAVKRMKLGNSIPMMKSEIQQIRKNNEFQLAEKTLRKVETLFAVRFPVNEIAYIAFHFMGGKVQKAVFGGSHIGNEIQSLTSNLVSRVSSRTHMDFSKDEDLRLGLSVHLQSTMNRLKHHLSVSNPILDPIKRMYPYLFDAVVNELVHLNKELQLHLPEEEAAYLTLHFQASLERMQKRNGSNRKTIIVCPMGIGASVLLRTKLERKFHSLDIIDTVSIYNIHHYSADDIDFIISTIPIPNTTLPVFEVTPLLTAEDQNKLQAFIDDLHDIPAESPNQVEGDFPNLRGLINEHNILINLDFGHPYEIIEALALKLLEHGYVKEDYIESAIIREQHSSTNIGGGIAIPHGDPSYIKESAIAVGVLKCPILWGKEYVSLVLTLAKKPGEKAKTKDLFTEIGSLCDNPMLVNNLIKQKTPMDFIKSL